MKSIAKYIIVFVITALIFISAFYFSSTLNERRFREIEDIQNQIAIDILASETQFELLQQVSCEEGGNRLLSREIGQLGTRLAFMEEQLGSGNDEVRQLKTYYSLLLIKDILLSSELEDKCDEEYFDIVYFYTSDCSECRRQGFILDRLRSDYPEVRVYALDYDLDIAAVQTLAAMLGVEDPERNAFPLLVIGDEIKEGFQELDELVTYLPLEITAPAEEADMESGDSTAEATIEAGV